MLQPNDVRLFIRDRPEWNRLLNKEEFSQEQIDQAMKLTVMLFNDITPSTQYTVKEFPYQYLLLIGTVYHLLFGGGLGRSRNRLAYQTDGVSVDDEAHADVELSLSSQLKAEFMQMAKDKKIEANVKRGWGNVPSEYRGAGYYKHIWFKNK